MRTIIAFILAGASVLAQSPAIYRISHTYVLGGDGAWDYIVSDPPTHRLFIGRANRVMVVDESSGTLVGEVGDIKGAHGTAIAPESGHGFATSGDDASVVMFDLKTLKVLGRIPAAEDADAIIYDQPSNRVFTFNGDAHSSTVIESKLACHETFHCGGKSRNMVSRPATARSREPDGYERGRAIDAKRAMVVRAGRRRRASSRVHGDRYRASPLVQRFRRAGVLAVSVLPGRHGGGDAADWDGRRRDRILMPLLATCSWLMPTVLST
jgi:hypothetical protein